MRSRFWLLPFGAFLTAMTSWASSSQTAMEFEPPAVVPGITRIGTHSHVIPDRGVRLVPNIGVVVGSRATLVIDTGLGPVNARTALAEIGKVGRTQTLYLSVTHSHPEHVAGLAAFPPGTIFIASRPVAAELARSKGFAGLAKLSPAIADMLQGATMRPPDVIFEGEHRLDLGGVRVRLLFLGPTHSEGDTLAFVEGDRVLYAGDVVLKKRFPSFSPESKSAAWLDVLARVKALNPRVVVPSHGEIGDVSTVETQRRVLIDMRDRVGALRAAGRSLEETTNTVVGEFHARYPDWRDSIPNEIAPIVRSMYAE